MTFKSSAAPLEPGEGRVIKCLVDHKAEMSESCLKFLYPQPEAIGPDPKLCRRRSEVLQRCRNWGRPGDQMSSKGRTERILSEIVADLVALPARLLGRRGRRGKRNASADRWDANINSPSKAIDHISRNYRSPICSNFESLCETNKPTEYNCCQHDGSGYLRHWLLAFSSPPNALMGIHVTGN